MGNMALGLFASLLIGTILQTVGEHVPYMGWLVEVAAHAKAAAGPAMAVAIAWALKAPPLVLFSCAAVGVAGNALGGPVGAFLAAIIGAEFGKAVSKETKIDILITPAVTVTSGVLTAMLAGPPVSALMLGLGKVVMLSTELQPFWMGILVSMIVGIVLTLPISSAALCVMLNLSGLAAGAATAGCCAQMIGFAVMSFSENRWGGLVSQGLGTSMLQMPNIVRNIRIWIPPTLAAAITGPLATMVFKLENIPVGAGMGTSGLVGPIGILTAMPGGGATMWAGIVLVCFVLPGMLSWLFYKLLFRVGWIKPGDVILDMK
ncbi:PTS sugar transporter subunit IIC [Clostridia bacterium OttesenSCG-928-O13]|nr:PTS sugar transporter subunit IIC [Clostridia bacterium OttesenSCG-928-O13]